ncbi:MAG: sulfite exporter TauE/SafE family protein [Clostridiales Family XIII bacterium]|jgi:uncharacterized membrane protein YfcA|nr:sulfite exporter TauE/SafE family protein [Clostridiales Family XIII bacterium]
MYDLQFIILMLATGLVAGIVGSILGLGGGLIVTPVLTLLMGIDIKYAIGASIVSVIGTSAGTSIAYLKDEILNIRLAMFLEIFTAIGAFIGAILASRVNGHVLYFFFTALYIYQSINMYQKIRSKTGHTKIGHETTLSHKLKLNSTYYDKATKEHVDYQLEKVPGGAAVMFGAGIASGMMGIGSGGFKVLAMDTVMKMPLKASTATSNFMMGVTAAASASVYFFSGYINPVIAAPIAVGIVAGSTIGSRIMQHLPAKNIRIIFIFVILIVAVQMFLKGIA